MAQNDNKNTSDWQQPANLCRCCLTEGCYKDISTEYFTSGQKEVYADMLLETFNICISYQDGGGPSSGSRLICDECISQLRDSHKFKKMILHSEETFKDRLERLRKPVERLSVKVKEEEPKEEEGDDASSDDYNLASLDDGAAFDDDSVPDIKIEDCKEEPVSFISEDDSQLVIEEPIKNRKSRRRKRLSKSEENKPATKKSRNALNMEQPVEASCSEPKKKGRDKIDGKEEEKEEKNNESSLFMKIQQKKTSTLQLMKHSNLTLFTCTKTKYKCFSCTECFTDFVELKEHSSKQHNAAEVEKRMRKFRNPELKKVEISKLVCRICDLQCKDLDVLVDHLKVHDIVVGEHFLMPFKLEDGFVCVFCDQRFDFFRKLVLHTHKHYKNHICEVCGGTFPNAVNLRCHVGRAHKQVKCLECGQTFKTASEKSHHRAKVHKIKIKRYCPICNEVSHSSYALMMHHNTAHGIKLPELKCDFCDRIFKHKSLLTTHVRRSHNGEKNHGCDKCDMRFYTKADLKRHANVHEKRKIVSCYYCESMFASVQNFKKHIKKYHANDSR